MADLCVSLTDVTARVIVGTKISERARTLIDAAAGRAGVNRSTWMRAALAYALASMPASYPTRTDSGIPGRRPRGGQAA